MRALVLFILLLLPAAISAQTYEELISKSYEYLDKDDLPAAEESLRKAMRLEPGNPHNYALLSNLGTIQRRQGKTEEALFSYTTALARHPMDIMVLSNRASLYADIGEKDKAIADYTSLLFTDSNNQDALYYRGMLHLQNRNFIEAESDFDKLLLINDKTLNGRIGFAVMEKMRGNYDESERIYNYLINEMPRHWDLYEGRADLYFMMEKNARAMADINRVFSNTTPSASTYVLRAKVKIAQYERESARNDLLTASEMGYDAEVIEELLKMCK